MCVCVCRPNINCLCSKVSLNFDYIQKIALSFKNLNRTVPYKNQLKSRCSKKKFSDLVGMKNLWLCNLLPACKHWTSYILVKQRNNFHKNFQLKTKKLFSMEMFTQIGFYSVIDKDMDVFSCMFRIIASYLWKLWSKCNSPIFFSIPQSKHFFFVV